MPEVYLSSSTVTSLVLLWIVSIVPVLVLAGKDIFGRRNLTLADIVMLVVTLVAGPLMWISFVDAWLLNRDRVILDWGNRG